MAKDNTFTLIFDKFYQGYGPLAFKNNLTEIGGTGHASLMQNANVINGDYVTQGPGLSTLTAGTEDGAITEPLDFIMDKAVSNGVSFAIGNTKLQKITTTAVTNDGTFPHTITDCAEGESIQVLDGDIYYFFNTSSAGQIGKLVLPSTFDDDWGSTTPTGAGSLQKAPHPSDKKEDIIAFGNGQYLGTYIKETNTLDVDKLDFGSDCEVADVVYNAGYWYIAVNSGVSGTNRNEGQIYLYNGSATTSLLQDETGVGMQRIGFLYRVNGIIYVAYQDLTSSGYTIGYIFGSQIKPLGKFNGSLPTFNKKTLYENTILFISSSSIYSSGAIIEDLPYQISQIADGGYVNVTAIAAPFGTPIVASNDGTHYKLAKFNGYDTASYWKSIIVPIIGPYHKGFIDKIVVLTKTLKSNARCDLILECDQGTSNSNTFQITTGKRLHSTTAIGLNEIEDIRVYLNWANGNSTNDCPIRRVIVQGHYSES
ncbi:MAG: hypothetical protein PHS54_01575 [Clostridia bacterium]|nr:hypothetical protein [Clostridia bacterium]